MDTLLLSIAAFLIAILLILVFYGKQNIGNKETKLYSKMLVINLIYSMLAIITFVYAKLFGNIFVISILQKCYMTSMLLIIMYMVLYNIVITGINKKKESLLSNLIQCVNFIFSVLIFIAPLNVINYGNVIDGNGLSYDIVLVLTVIYLMFIIISTINIFLKSKGNFSKDIPFIVLIILYLIGLIVRKYFPSVMFENFFFSFMLLIMYFTIENPDLKMLQEFHKQRELAEKSNNEKVSFLFNISNDLKEPILNIRGISNNILEKDNIDEIKEDARTIKSSSNELLQLVDNVLDVSELEKRKIGIRGRQYNVYNLFNTINKLFEKTLDENIEYRFNYDNNIPEYLYGDSIRLKQIMNILLDNARTYTKEGFIEVNVNHIIKHNVCRLIITVEDSGRGIDSEELKHLFDKEKIYSDETLKTIDDSKNNLGVLKSLVNLMNGSVVVNSEYGKGTKFIITIDQKVKIEKTEIIETVEKYEELYENKSKVLLVTDEEDIQKQIKKLLKKYDIELEIVEGGQACLEKIRANKKYNMILIEEDLPKLSSEDTLFKLEELGVYKTPIIILTLRKEFGVEEELIKKGFKDVIKLPLKKEEALKTINKYLKK